MKNKFWNIKLLLCLVGLLLVATSTVFAACHILISNGSCPSFTPTTSGACGSTEGCRSYYEYTTNQVYTAIDLPNGSLEGCAPSSFSASYKYHSVMDNCGSLTPQCLIHSSVIGSTSCSTVSCNDWCYGG